MQIIVLSIYYLCLIVTCLCGLAAAVSDFRGMKIPNLYSGIVILSFFIAFPIVSMTGFDCGFSSLISHILSGIICFGFTYMMFAFGAFGAGDSKLITAFGFWTGLQGLPVFIFYVTIAGAVLALLAMALMRFPVFANMPEGSWIARIRARERVIPYGIAISFGAFAAFFSLGYFSVLLSWT